MSILLLIFCKVSMSKEISYLFLMEIMSIFGHLLMELYLRRDQDQVEVQVCLIMDLFLFPFQNNRQLCTSFVLTPNITTILMTTPAQHAELHAISASSKVQNVQLVPLDF